MRLEAERAHELTEEGQVTNRYTKAIEQLGSGRLDVRLSAIYALERIMIDSARDHPTIVEVLAAFVREHAPVSPPSLDPDNSGRLPAQEPPLATDVQAAVTVLGRRPAGRIERGPVDLARAYLTRAALAGANLVRAALADADLEGADLTYARLAEARLVGANLTGAHLAGADLISADLRHALLYGVDLAGADLSHAKLTGWIPSDAHLAGADLTGVDLMEVTLSDEQRSVVRSPSSAAPGKPDTRRSSGSGRAHGPSSCPSSRSMRRSAP